MARLKYNVKFPCGYEISMECQASMFDNASAEFDEDKFKECPLHGKKCKNNK